MSSRPNFLRRKILEPVFWFGLMLPVAMLIGIITLLWDDEDDDDFDLEPLPSPHSSQAALALCANGCQPIEPKR
jgi:hypothetical protein